MSRRAQAIKREIFPDAKYHSVIVAKLINKVMRCGKKSTAEGIVYGALQVVEQQESKAPVSVLEQAVRNATPLPSLSQDQDTLLPAHSSPIHSPHCKNPPAQTPLIL